MCNLIKDDKQYSALIYQEAIPDKNIFLGEVEKIRRDDGAIEITVSGITNEISDKTKKIYLIIIHQNRQCSAFVGKSMV